jgi:nicotinamidase-related amidase
MKNNCSRVSRTQAALIVIDIQERLLPAIFEQQRVIENSVRLIRGAQTLEVPVLLTEQYRRGLGATAPEVAAAVAGFAPMEKLAFSACGATGFVPALRNKNLRQAILCGIEAHVCVTQTCLDLLGQGFEVFVAADAISARTPENWRIGVERMRGAGAVIVSTEMVLFELLEKAGTDQFRRILELVK